MMKRSGSGRIARKVGAHNDDESPDTGGSSLSEAQNRSSESVVKRPAFGKSKKRSSLRMSFGPAEPDGNDGDEPSDTAVVTPKKSNLSRIAMEKNAQLRARSPLVPEASRRDTGEDRPSYDKDALAELRKSTPSTPKDLVVSAEEEEETRALDIASKFGPSASLIIQPESSAIPTQAEIQEKKARRRRLAKEKDAHDPDENQPWASDDDDEFRASRNEISLRPKEKYAETRLVPDDEDIAEGFDDFVEDGKISLGRTSEREAQRKRRAEMAELINNAEGASGDDGSDDSEEERNAAFAAAQARAGRYGEKDKSEDDGARTPPRIAPLPDLGDILKSLQSELDTKQLRKEMVRKRLDELKEEKVRVGEEKQYLQELLDKTGEKFEKERQQSGLPVLPANGAAGNRLLTERGLDSLGTTPRASGSHDSDEE
ncbi:hypothetical protein P280DRAFT_553201 [Massarina eburnea CBS 473.64]|uniref:Uncharacterized protein n=1 Tax=Massarina eburnea CBS 473.64 TaxID=1395130 RepID=A0A6A6RLF2_9PLEO|nr:hypothetical protein P280DRAFT_553201 [Massarina eburnea CBS 473.64]